MIHSKEKNVKAKRRIRVSRIFLILPMLIVLWLCVMPIFANSYPPVFQQKSQQYMTESWQIGYPNSANVTAVLDNGILTISGIGAVVSNATFPPWYNVKDQITCVFINEGVTNIGENYFINHTNLSYVFLATSITSIDNKAFKGCTNLTSISIPHHVTHIGDEVFFNCGLTKIRIPESVTTIGVSTFRNCPLADIAVNWLTTPPSVTADVFLGMSMSQVNLFVPKGIQNYYAVAPIWQNFNIVEKTDWTLLNVVLRNTQFGSTNTTISSSQYNDILLSIKRFETLVEDAVLSLDLKINSFAYTNLVTKSLPDEYYGYFLDKNDVSAVLSNYNPETYDGVSVWANVSGLYINYGGLTWGALLYSFVPFFSVWGQPDEIGYTYRLTHEWEHQIETWFDCKMADLHEFGGNYPFSSCAHDDLEYETAYLLQVSPQDWQLSPTSGNFYYDYEITPTNSWQTHTSTISSEIGIGCDHNIYKLPVVSGGEYSFHTNSGEGGSSADFASELYIYDHNFNQLAWYMDGNTDYTFNYTGKAYIRVSEYGGAGYQPNTIGHYTLAYKQISPFIEILSNVVNEIAVFPNPVKDQLFIKSDSQIEKVEIYSSIGNLLMLENNFYEKISVSTLPAGLYFLKIHSDNRVVVRAVVKA